MNRILGVLVSISVVAIGAFAVASASGSPSQVSTPTPPATPAGHVATHAELAQAQAEWAQSAHANTYDDGLGANTTCARCKSPLNWDPSQDLAARAALDCGACKRVPGAPRPKLTEGAPVPEAEWHDIECSVCHIPVDGSYYTGVAFWNQASGHYDPVASVAELCAHCHEGQHGFEVVDEQAVSPAHTGWECTACHGSHGTPAACTDCHDPTVGAGAYEHSRHSEVNCTACHDAGGLSIWQDTEPGSRHYLEYIPLRFAHTVTSWPSHNLQTETRCERCHHPRGMYSGSVASEISCDACHPDGAVLFWCEDFTRNPDPNVVQDSEQ